MHRESDSVPGPAAGRRRQYAPPRVARVALEAEQVLSVGCKMDLPWLPAVMQTEGCGLGVNCQKAGS